MIRLLALALLTTSASAQTVSELAQPLKRFADAAPCGLAASRDRSPAACASWEPEVRARLLDNGAERWVFLGPTPTISWCRMTAHGLGFRYFWVNPVVEKSGVSWKCYAGNTLNPAAGR